MFAGEERGTFHAFGNGTLDADFDIDKDGNISGGAKGILTWDGKAENWK